MRLQQRLARDLVARLSKEGIDADLRGRGVHWTVRAEAGRRTCRVGCRHFAEPSKALEHWGPRGNLHLGDRHGPPTVDAGPQYDIVFRVDDDRFTGWTDEPEKAVGAVRAWLDGSSRGALVAVFDFVDRSRRLLDAVEDLVLDARPDVEIVDGTDAVATYRADARSAECETGAGVPRVAFASRGARLARGEFPAAEPAAAAIERWLDGLDPDRFDDPRVEVDRYAALFEEGRYAEWGWAHQLDRARAGDPTLAYHLALLEAFQASTVVSRFFAFTSMSTFCLSRSSHYPFDTADLPRMTPRREGGWTLVWGEDRFEGDVGYLLPLIEDRIRPRPDPYLGSLDQRMAPTLEAALEGTTLDVEPPLRLGARGVVVTHPDGDRTCVVHAALHGRPGRIAFEEHGASLGEAQASSLEETVELLIDWLDGRMALDDLAAAASDWRGFATAPARR